MRWIRSIAAGLIVLAVVAGPPAAVTLWAFSPSGRWPTAGQARAWLADPLTPPALLVAVLLVAAMLWLILAAAVLRGVLRRLRQGWGRVRRMSLPTPAQATAGSMVGVAAFGIPAAATAADVPQPPPAAGAGHLGDPTAPPKATAAHRRAADAGTRHAGVDLPDGGWAPAETAHTVAAVAGLVWLRRRRAYRPTALRLDRLDRGDDPDLRPLPITAQALQAAAGSGPDAGAALVVGGDVAGPLHVDDLPHGGLGLTGPGAADAARGLLVTAALIASLPGHHPGGRVRLVVARADLTALIGAAAVSAVGLPGLLVTDGSDTALNPAVTDGAGTCGGTSPPVIVVTRAPTESRAAEQLSRILRARRARVVVLGGWPSLPAWHIAGDGAVTSADPAQTAGRAARMCVLGARAAVDLLTLLHTLHGTPDTHTPGRPAAVRGPAPIPGQTAPDAAPGRGDATPAALRLRVLGAPTLLVDDEPVLLRRAATLQALAVLAVHPDGVTATQLCVAVWPGLPAHTLTHRVYNTISDLRRTLQDLTAQTVVLRRGDRYLLDPARIDVDLWHLHAAVRRAAAAVTTGDRLPALRTLISQYTGDVCAGETWPWLNTARERVRRPVVDAYTELADTATDPLPLLRAAIEIDPINEDLHRRTMHALAVTGDRGAVTRLCDAYQHRLADAGLPATEDLPALAAQLTAVKSPQPH
jgi:DNA-binding SARP family transcriptional activator